MLVPDKGIDTLDDLDHMHFYSHPTLFFQRCFVVSFRIRARNFQLMTHSTTVHTVIADYSKYNIRSVCVCA